MEMIRNNRIKNLEINFQLRGYEPIALLSMYDIYG